MPLNPLLTAWSRVLLEKLAVFQLAKKFTAFYGNRKFITAFTSAHQSVPIAIKPPLAIMFSGFCIFPLTRIS
jgi:hypothetical protein